MAWRTGDGKLTLQSSPQSGWIMADDGTIGGAASNASNRANADVFDLFALLYGFADADAPLLGSDGSPTTRAAQGNASAAFAAQCQITLTRQLGRSLAIAGAGAGLTPRTLGSFDGNENHTLTIGEMPPHTHTVPNSTSGALGSFLRSASTNTGTVTTSQTGSGDPFNIMNPRAYWNIEIKL